MKFNQKYKNINLEKVKELEQIITAKLDIITLLIDYGVDVGDGVKMSSPFGDDLAPSFFVDQERQLWNDFSQGWGGGFVYLYQKLNQVLKSRNLNYYQCLEEILKRYPNVREEFTGSLYTLENLSTLTLPTSDELRDKFNSKYNKPTYINLENNKWIRAEKLKRSKDIPSILKFCIELQNSSTYWENQESTEKVISTPNNENALTELRRLSSDLLTPTLSQPSRELNGVSLTDLANDEDL